MTSYRRKFGKNTVTVCYSDSTGNWTIVIRGKFLSNHGLIYKLGVKPAHNRQVIGMDSSFGLTQPVLDWIYDIAERRILADNK